MQPNKAKIFSKIIISGEHAVIYGCPALFTVTDNYIESTLTENNNNKIIIHLENYNLKQQFSKNELKKYRDIIAEKYQNFLKNNLKITEILKKPEELTKFIIADLTNKYQISGNFTIKVTSNIPTGSGMGSSAALIISIIKLFNNTFNLNLNSEEIYQIALKSENLQHGHSSGIDLKAVMHGKIGIINYFQNNKIIKNCQTNIKFNLINSGIPESSTGECVEHASIFFNKELKNKFTAITNNIYQAMAENNETEFIKNIKKNHQLLCLIGVVPNKIQQQILKIEKNNGAAKICGAGSTKGNNSGIILSKT